MRLHTVNFKTKLINANYGSGDFSCNYFAVGLF